MVEKLRGRGQAIAVEQMGRTSRMKLNRATAKRNKQKKLSLLVEKMGGTSCDEVHSGSRGYREEMVIRYERVQSPTKRALIGRISTHCVLSCCPDQLLLYCRKSMFVLGVRVLRAFFVLKSLSPAVFANVKTEEDQKMT